MHKLCTAVACAVALAGLQAGLAAATIDAAYAQAPAPAAAPAPGSEAALRLVIDQIQQSKPDYDRMGPELADAARQQMPQIQPFLAGLGKVTDVKFVQKGPQDSDVFTVTFEHGATTWAILLGSDGKIVLLAVQPAT